MKTTKSTTKLITRHGWQCNSALGGVFVKQKLQRIKLAWRPILFAGALIAALAFTIACTNSSGPDTKTPDPEPVTVTKDVTVTFPAYTSGQTSMSFAPTYTPEGGWGEHSSATDITFTVTSKDFNGNLVKTYTDGFGDITIAGGPYLYDKYTFTMTFKIGNTVVGSQDIGIVVTTTFTVLQKADSTTNLSPQEIPSVTLHLEKTK